MTNLAKPTKDRIVAAANKLFYDEGIRSVGVDAVAAKAGVTKRTLYYHFKSKDDLVAAYLAARVDHLAERLQRRRLRELLGEVRGGTGTGYRILGWGHFVSHLLGC